MQELMKVRIDARFLKIYEKYVEAWRNSAKTPQPPHYLYYLFSVK